MPPMPYEAGNRTDTWPATSHVCLRWQRQEGGHSLARSDITRDIDAPGTGYPDGGLARLLPEVEAALPNGFLPPPAKWGTAAQKLTAIAEAGDVETQNALEGLQRAVDTLAADPTSGQTYLDADEALLAALDDMAKRCKLVGSSALQ